MLAAGRACVAALHALERSPEVYMAPAMHHAFSFMSIAVKHKVALFKYSLHPSGLQCINELLTPPPSPPQQ